MKQTLGAAQPNDNVVGVALLEAATSTLSTPSTESAPSSCPASYTCPENDDCIIQGSNDRAFTLACNKDFYGGDFQNLGASSLEVCADTCANNADCIAASYVGGKGPGACYLESKNNVASYNDNVDGLVLYTGPLPSPSVTATSSPVETSSSSSSATSSSTTAALATPTTSSCTAPTPVACFTTTAHGQPVVEGQTLNQHAWYSSPYFGTADEYSTYTPATYGIWPEGYVSIVSPDNKGWYMKSRAGAEGVQEGTPDWLMSYPDQYEGWFRNVCKMDLATKGLSCRNGNLCDMTITGPDNAIPSCGKYEQGLKITAAYDLITCPPMC